MSLEALRSSPLLVRPFCPLGASYCFRSLSYLSFSLVASEEASSLSDSQKQKLVEAVATTTSKITFLMAQATRSQGTVMALRDVQVNWNLPDERRWTELGAWKTVSRHTNQMMSRVANDLKKLKRKQLHESIAPKGISTVSLLELYENASKEA